MKIFSLSQVRLYLAEIRNDLLRNSLKNAETELIYHGKFKVKEFWGFVIFPSPHPLLIETHQTLLHYLFWEFSELNLCTTGEIQILFHYWSFIQNWFAPLPTLRLSELEIDLRNCINSFMNSFCSSWLRGLKWEAKRKDFLLVIIIELLLARSQTGLRLADMIIKRLESAREYTNEY